MGKGIKLDFKRYAEAFSEAERDFEESVESFGLPFERVELSSLQARRNRATLRLRMRERRRRVATWMDIACVPCLPHRRAHGDVFRRPALHEELLLLLQSQSGRVRVFPRP